MSDVATALLVTFVIVGVVLLLVGGLAYYGYREALRPPSPRSLRRMAYALGAFSFFGFGYATAAVVLGEEIPWFVVIQCCFLLAMAAGWLRDPRISVGHE
jgi:hypothetical protein